MAADSVTRELGAVPTPQKIVKNITHLILDYWENHRETLPPTDKLNVLDPAVGDGRFLIEFRSNFHNRAKKKSWGENLHCYGLDINKNAIKTASKNIQNIKSQNIPEISLKAGNALLGFITAPNTWKETWSTKRLNDYFLTDNNLKKMKFQKNLLLFHWFKEWPEVIESGGFDIIIGNPPYGIHLKNEKNLYRLLYKAIDPEIESYLLFIERIVQLLREGGLVGIIIPSNLATNLYYQKIRQFLLNNVKILRFINLDRQIFPKIHVEVCILILQRISIKNKRDSHKIRFERLNDISHLPVYFDQQQYILQKKIQKNPYQMLLPSPNAEISIILEKIEKNSIPLKMIADISRGIELGFTHSELTSEKMLGQDYVPLIAGRSIRKFRLNKNVRYIRFDKNNKSIFKNYDLYLEPKLLLRRIGHELIAVYDPNQLFCVCDVYMIILNSSRPTSELIYLEALLNSSLMSFYLLQRFTSVKQIFPKIPIKYLKVLPIKIPSNQTKILQLAENLHRLPWNIQQASSYQLFKDLNKEIFKIYDIENNEWKTIYKSHKLENYDLT